MIVEYIPPSPLYTRYSVGFQVYSCFACGKEVYINDKVQDTKPERKARIRRYNTTDVSE